MSLFHLSQDYLNYKDLVLDDFSANIVVQVPLHPTIFTTLPFQITVLGSAQVAFHLSIDATKQGGPQATKDKADKRMALENLLRELSFYIQSIPGMTAANAELSGFKTVTGGHHPPVALTPPVILRINNIASTKLGFKLKGSYGARMYKLRYTIGSGAPVACGEFPSTRDVVVPGLIPGTFYNFQACAMGGGKSVSEWSEPVGHMST